MSIDEIMNALDYRAMRVTDECAIGMREDLTIITSTPGYGIPAPAGTPPHLQTGRLSASNKTEIRGRVGDVVTAETFNDCPYAAHVERSRPFFEPVADHWRQEYQQRLTQEFGG